jgi:hypothetical protein
MSKLPKFDEQRNTKGKNGSVSDSRSNTPLAEIVYFTNTPDHQSELIDELDRIREFRKARDSRTTNRL